MDEGPTTGPTPAEPAVRERYLRVLLNGLEGGVVAPDEYSYRVALLEAARSEAEMRRIVQETTFAGLSPSPDRGAPRRRRPAPAHIAWPEWSGEGPLERASARIAGRSPGAGGGREARRRRRWTAVVAVAIMLLALLLLGAYMIAAVHRPSSPGGTVLPGASRVMAAPAMAGAAQMSSPSSRR